MLSKRIGKDFSLSNGSAGYRMVTMITVMVNYVPF